MTVVAFTISIVRKPSITYTKPLVGDKLYVLGSKAANRYGRYHDIWLLEKSDTVDGLLNSKTSSIEFPQVKSAFTLTLGGGLLQTTLGNKLSFLSVPS